MIGSSENRISYNGNGIATEFAYTFKILEKSNLKVLHVAADGTEELLTTDYYVDMEKSVVLYPGYAPGAEIPEQNRPPILPVGERLVLYREVPITQESALDKHWPFNVIENGLDKLTIICQQIWDRLQRSFYVSESTSTNFDPKVPIEAGKTFRVKDDGTGFEVTEDPGKVIDGATALLKQTTEQAELAKEQAAASSQSAVSAQNAANTAEKIATDLGLVDEAVQTAVSSAEQASDSANTASNKADIAVAKADVATAKANEASTSAATATQKAEAASGSATSAAKSYANADAIATQLTEYLATKETLTAPAVDKTLLIEGAAADSKVVGELKSDLDNYLCLNSTKLISGTRTNNKIFNNTTNSYESVNGFYSISFDVKEGETYKVSGWGSTTIYSPTFLNESTIIEATKIVGSYNDEVITVPTNANKLIINGREGVQEAIAYKIITNEKSVEFFEDYEAKKYPSIGINFSGNDVQIYRKWLSKNYDLMTWFRQKAMNSLLDIYGWYLIPNNTNKVSVSHEASERIGILSGQTDFIQPFKMWAVNNIDGDFTDPTIRKFTGGWHGYDNHTEGDYSATARTVSINVFCDGVLVNSGETAIGDYVRVLITNRIQASNTEKEDGSGREVLEATYECIFSSDTPIIKINCTLHALEEVNLNRVYGFAIYRSSLSDECRAIGSRNHRGAFSLGDNILFDEYTTGIVEYCNNGSVEMGIDTTVDLGSGYANTINSSLNLGSGKAYLDFIDEKSHTATSGLHLNGGDEVRMSAYYKVIPNKND